MLDLRKRKITSTSSKTKDGERHCSIIIAVSKQVYRDHLEKCSVHPKSPQQFFQFDSSVCWIEVHEMTSFFTVAQGYLGCFASSRVKNISFMYLQSSSPAQNDLWPKVQKEGISSMNMFVSITLWKPFWPLLFPYRELLVLKDQDLSPWELQVSWHWEFIL